MRLSPSPVPLFALLLSLACAGVPRTLAAAENIAPTGAYALELTDELGAPLPTYARGGRTYVLGSAGQRYLLKVRNNTGRRIEVVGAVDGRDVINGQPSSWQARGYIVGPYAEVVIDGFRLNEQSVAAFRFGSVARSYAARMGDARDVGVVGVAVFTEREPVYMPPPVYRHHVSMNQEPLPPSPPAGAAMDKAAKAPAPSAMQDAQARAESRPGLGTEFGEAHASDVVSVEFQRASPTPAAVLSLRYNDRPGLLALGIDVDGTRWGQGDDQRLRETAQPFRRDFAEPPPGWQP